MFSVKCAVGWILGLMGLCGFPQAGSLRVLSHAPCPIEPLSHGRGKVHILGIQRGEGFGQNVHLVLYGEALVYEYAPLALQEEQPPFGIYLALPQVVVVKLYGEPAGGLFEYIQDFFVFHGPYFPLFGISLSRDLMGPRGINGLTGVYHSIIFSVIISI